MFDTRSGRLLAHWGLRDGSQTVAIDPRTGTLFITNAAASTVTLVVLPAPTQLASLPPAPVITLGCCTPANGIRCYAY